MWRYLAGAGATLLLVAAGIFFFRGTATPPGAQSLPPAPVAATTPEPLPDAVPEAAPLTREQKRFDRVDKNHDNIIVRDEYFALRRTLFAGRDKNHDGMLSFEEWADKGYKSFAKADKDKSDTLTRTEYATTAVKHKPTPHCACKTASPPPHHAEEEEGAED